jgi:trypsin
VDTGGTRLALAVRMRSITMIAILSTLSGCLGLPTEEGGAGALSAGSMSLVDLTIDGASEPCTGVAVSPRVVLTAKHCVDWTNAPHVQVWQVVGESSYRARGSWTYYLGAPGITRSPEDGSSLDLAAVLFREDVGATPATVSWNVGPQDASATWIHTSSQGVQDHPVTIREWTDGHVAFESDPSQGADIPSAGDPLYLGDALIGIVGRIDEALPPPSSPGSSVYGAVSVIRFGKMIDSAVSSGWGHLDRITQSHEVVDGVIHAQSDVLIRAAPDRVMAALQRNWAEWWYDCRVIPHPNGPDGSNRFEFHPVIPLPTTVEVTMHPPVWSVDHQSATAAVDLGGPHFVGTARFVLTTVDDGTQMRSEWLSVTTHGIFSHVTDWAAGMHLKAENGTSLVKGTGFPGLIDFLERWQDLRPVQ